MPRFDLSYTGHVLRDFLIFPARLAGKTFVVAKMIWCVARADRYVWRFRLPDGGTERMVRPDPLVILERVLDEIPTTPGLAILDPGDEDTPEWMVLDFTAGVRAGEWTIDFPEPEGSE